MDQLSRAHQPPGHASHRPRKAGTEPRSQDPRSHQKADRYRAAAAKQQRRHRGRHTPARRPPRAASKTPRRPSSPRRPSFPAPAPRQRRRANNSSRSKRHFRDSLRPPSTSAAGSTAPRRPTEQGTKARPPSNENAKATEHEQQLTAKREALTSELNTPPNISNPPVSSKARPPPPLPPRVTNFRPFAIRSRARSKIHRGRNGQPRCHRASPALRADADEQESASLPLQQQTEAVRHEHGQLMDECHSVTRTLVDTTRKVETARQQP